MLEYTLHWHSCPSICFRGSCEFYSPRVLLFVLFSLTRVRLGPGFQVEAYLNFSCNTFSNALHFSVGQMPRWRCPNYHPERNLVVPSSSYDIQGEHRIKVGRMTNRDIFIYFSATCLEKPMTEDFDKNDLEMAKVTFQKPASPFH